MAKTPAEYKRDYESFNADSIRQFSESLKLLSGTDSASTEKWTKLLVALVKRRRRLASTLAGSQFTDYRKSLNVPGSAPRVPSAIALDERRFMESLKATALVPLYQAEKAIAELDPEDGFLAPSLREEAQRRSLVAGSGMFTRYVQESYFETMETLSDEDSESTRYRRIVSAGSCSWCALLATRGAVYLTARTALSSHDFCRCIALPDYGVDDDPNFKRADEIWESVADEGLTGKEAVNEFRRRYDDKTETARTNRSSKTSQPVIDTDGRNPLDADKTAEALEQLLASLEKSLLKHDNKPTRSRATQIRAELSSRS